jgi:hypothetical protein
MFYIGIFVSIFIGILVLDKDSNKTNQKRYDYKHGEYLDPMRQIDQRDNHSYWSNFNNDYKD